MNSSLNKQKEEEMFGSRRGCDIEILGIWEQQVLGGGGGRQGLCGRGGDQDSDSTGSALWHSKFLDHRITGW